MAGVVRQLHITRTERESCIQRLSIAFKQIEQLTYRHYQMKASNNLPILSGDELRQAVADMNAAIYQLENELGVPHGSPTIGRQRLQERIDVLQAMKKTLKQPEPAGRVAALPIPAKAASDWPDTPPETGPESTSHARQITASAYEQLSPDMAKRFGTTGGKMLRDEFFKMNPRLQLEFVSNGGAVVDAEQTAATEAKDPSPTAGLKTMKRAAFFKMTPQQQLDSVNGGIELID